jgi:hypothetical protein
MLPSLLPLLAIQQAPAPVSARTVACVLELHGNLNTRQRSGKGTETVSETFQLAIHGRLEEVESRSGAVSFTFTAAQDPRFPPTGMLNRRTEVHGRSTHEVVQFYGSQIKVAGPLRFTSGLRGQNLYPLGHFEIAGHASIHDSRGTHHEQCTVRLVPFPEIRQGPGDFAAPTLRFGLSSLWKLQRTDAPFMVKGSVTYRNSSGGASYAGRMELTFMLDPRTSK